MAEVISVQKTVHNITGNTLAHMNLLWRRTEETKAE